MFDISQLTTDPTKRGAIMAENNTAIVTTAKRAQSNLAQMESASRKLNTLEADSVLQDMLFDQNAAGQVLETTQVGTESLFQMRTGAIQTAQVLATQVGRLNELGRMLADPNFRQDQDRKTVRAAEKEFKKLDQDAFKTQQLLQATRNAMGQTAQMTGQIAEVQTQQLKLERQARDNISQTSQMLDLRNKLEETKLKFDNDNTLLQYVTQRQALSAQEVAAGDEISSDTNKFLWNIVNRGQNMDKFGLSEAKKMQALRQSLSGEENRALGLLMPHFIRAEVAGVPLDIEQYKIIAANDGETGALRILAELSGDSALVETVDLGKNAIYSRLVQQKTEAASKDLPVGTTLSDSQLKGIQQAAFAEAETMRASDVLAEAKALVNQDLVANSTARGQDLLTSVADNAGELLNPMLYGAEIRDWFRTPEAQVILKTPNSEHGTPLPTTAAKLVKALKETGMMRNDTEAVGVVSDLVGNAARADYKTRSDLGMNKYSREAQALERLGVDYGTGVVGSAPVRSRVQSERQMRYLDNPTDLALLIEDLRRFENTRDNSSIKARIDASIAAPRGGPIPFAPPPTTSTFNTK